MLLNSQCITKEIKKDIKRYTETNYYNSTTIQNLRDTAKAALRGKFIAIQSYLRKEEKLKIKNANKKPNLTHRTFRGGRIDKAPYFRRKEIIKIRAEIHNRDKIIEKINKTKSWLIEKINKIDQLLSRLIEKKRERVQINKISNEKEGITTDTPEIQLIMREHYEQRYANKIDNLEEMDRLLQSYKLLFF